MLISDDASGSRQNMHRTGSFTKHLSWKMSMGWLARLVRKLANYLYLYQDGFDTSTVCHGRTGVGQGRNGTRDRMGGGRGDQRSSIKSPGERAVQVSLQRKGHDGGRGADGGETSHQYLTLSIPSALCASLTDEILAALQNRPPSHLFISREQPLSLS